MAEALMRRHNSETGQTRPPEIVLLFQELTSRWSARTRVPQGGGGLVADVAGR